MPYILNTPQQIEQMQKAIGVNSLDELFSHLPDAIKIQNLELPPGASEMEVKEVLETLAKKNRGINKFNSFLGAGLYDHYIPAALNHLLSRSEFYTSYTPYQAECSQGILQAIYEYQSFVCLLTTMDVSNDSLYDGATSVAESVLMALRITKRNKILVALSVHPEYRAVLNTYLSGLNHFLKEIPYISNGLINLDWLKEAVDENIGCVVIQSPNFFGLIEDIEKVDFILKEKGVKLIMVVNPISLAILKSPAELGADIVCGEGQPLGGELNFGGPSFGFLAAKQEYLRQLPGRIVGKTIDSQGKTAYCITLQAREQHIRHEKATSNICSNQSLNTIGAAIYLALLGKEGFKKAALYSLNSAHYLYQRLQEIEEVTLPFSKLFFNEFIWQINDAPTILKKLMKKGILGGVNMAGFYPQLTNCILSACTEKKSQKDIDNFIDILKQLIYG